VQTADQRKQSRAEHGNRRGGGVKSRGRRGRKSKAIEQQRKEDRRTYLLVARSRVGRDGRSENRGAESRTGRHHGRAGVAEQSCSRGRSGAQSSRVEESRGLGSRRAVPTPTPAPPPDLGVP
jgi:hypothetical protein